MDSSPPERSPAAAASASRFPPRPILLAILLVGVVIIGMMFKGQPARSKIDNSFFWAQIKANNIARVELSESRALGVFKDPPLAPPKIDARSGKVEVAEEGKEPARLELHFEVDLSTASQSRADLEEYLRTSGVDFDIIHNTEGALIITVAYIILPLVMFGLLFLMLRRTQSQIMGGGFLSGFAKSPAKRYEGAKQAVTFNDVAGLEGVKADLMEIVDFLKNPQKFQKLGGRVPKGVLLNGPPGTGKTLLARAVAGEAGVPFFSVNGSEFIQMFVGVGASRVRDLFLTAKETSPAIIFVDEIDAVGRQRGAGVGGGHDEREQTLNQILSEMDGFSQTDAVIVLAATNRPDVLDPALLRPGRFDRHITVGRPTQRGRHEIFKVHVRDVPLADDVDLERQAAVTVGLTGADIRNIVNEAALWAARHDKTKVSAEDFEYARDKVLIGPKREEVLQGKEKELTAYHEAGHTLLAWFLPGAHRVHKVTIIPRGRAAGVTQFLPNEERMSMAQGELRDYLCTLLGGRGAEHLMYGESSVGDGNDLERATDLARRMVTHWGMSDKIGPVSYKLTDEDPFLGREMHQHRQISEQTMQVIDAEVTRLLQEAHDRAMRMLTERRTLLDKLALKLLENEELDEPDITEVLGPSVHQLAKQNGQPVGK